MIIEIILGVIAVICAIFFFWYRKLPRYRLTGDFPSPPGVFLLGHAPYINSTKKLLNYLNEQLLLNGGVIKIVAGIKVLLVVSKYEFLEWILGSTTLITKGEEYEYLQNWLGQGLILSTGAYWREHRKILTPAFHFQIIQNHISVLDKSIKVLLKKLEENVEKDSVDIYPIISSFSLDAVCESSMATSVNAQETSNSDYVQSIQNICRILIIRSFHLLKMFNFFFWFCEENKIWNDSVKIIHKFDNNVIKERREALEERKKREEEKQEENETDNVYERKKTPFLDLLLNARNSKGEPLTDLEIREEVDTIMFAGYETTASALSFVLFNLANHADVQKLAFEEQKKFFADEVNPTITLTQFNDMKYLEMVIKETLRLYPSVPFIMRKIHEDTYYKGQLLPKGMSLSISLFTVHRNPEFYPDPEKFDPSRFDGDVKRPTYSYIPFSAGLRNCIGQKFAMIEIKQVVSAILRNFELLPSEPTHILDLAAETSLKSKNGICIKLKKRLY